MCEDEAKPLRGSTRFAGGSLRSWLGVLCTGQLLSVFVTGTGTFSQLLANRGVNIPTTQSFVNYFLLSFFALPFIFKKIPLTVKWWKYAIVAFFDVQGNFLMVKAYQYTTITSVQLLDCGTIFMVMFLAKGLLKAEYSRLHNLGTAICLVGLGMLVLSDFLLDRFDGNFATSPLFGDILVLGGCVCYAISNVFQEHVVKLNGHGVIEFLGMLGVFGAMVSGVQILILEREQLAAVDLSDEWFWVYNTAFTVCLFCLYTFTSRFIESTSAVFLNLNLLTADFWSILVATCVFQAQLSPLYFAAFFCTVTGLIIYNLATRRQLKNKVELESVPSSPPSMET